MHTIRTRSAAAILLAAAAAITPAEAAHASARTTHKYAATLQSTPVSPSDGYPAVGGKAIVAGALIVKPLGGGAVVDRVKVMAMLEPNEFWFTGQEVDYYAAGTLRSLTAGYATVSADGSQQIVVEGQFHGGTGSYRGATGHFRFNGTVPAGSMVLSGRSTGSVEY